MSLFIKDKLYIGEATCAGIAGLIFGPHCLNWFDPLLWGNLDMITLEICRLVLCIQIVAVAVELPKKYMLKHWLSVAILLLPVMTVGWLVVGVFIYIVIPGFHFTDGLLVSACVTATDPVLAAAVVGKGKFAERVPGHLRNLLTAESGCNDGMAFPFIFLSLNLILYLGQAGEIVKNWFCLTILWECGFGIVLGVFIGYSLRKLIYWSEKWKLIDRQSFLAFFVFLAFICAGFGSILGIDDLLCSFAAGTAFGWNGEFARKTEESHVSTVIDLLLNLSFFVYFGAIVPWQLFNDGSLGLNVWRLIIIAIVIIFLRRIPAVLAMKPFTPDIKLWREALFCGHFGPIGVGAIFAAILARKDLEAHYTEEETPLAHLPLKEFPHYQLIATIWPIVCFIVVTSIIVHGSLVAVLALGKKLNRMAITMTFTTTNTKEGGSHWMDRLKGLELVATNFSLHRVDSQGMSIIDEKQFTEDEPDDYNYDDGDSQLPETLGVKVRPAGGAKRKRKHKKKRRHHRSETADGEETLTLRRKPEVQTLQLGKLTPGDVLEESRTQIDLESIHEPGDDVVDDNLAAPDGDVPEMHYDVADVPPEIHDALEHDQIPHQAYKEGDNLIIEDQTGEIIDQIKVDSPPRQRRRLSLASSLNLNLSKLRTNESNDVSIHSMDLLVQKMSHYSAVQLDLEQLIPDLPLRRLALHTKRAFVHKDDPQRRQLFAHQIDDLILIENEDGEIIRRYRVNRRPPVNPQGGRARLGTFRHMANRALGRKVATPEEHWTEESPQMTLTDGVQDPRLEAKLNKAFGSASPHSGTKPTVAKPTVSRPPQAIRRGDTVTAEPEHETEVERRRRLQALGAIPTKKTRDDEEE